ncbi:MAG: hypothetical protein NT092_07950 [Bacteroidia bacterium]|nr:hypothetical protein [Bacteroidia bacterium]
MRISILFLLCLLLTVLSCEKDEPAVQNPELEGGFLAFSTNGQTILSTAIKSNQKQVKFEVESDVDITKLVPWFEVPTGISVYLNGVEQVSGSSTIDFSRTVTYELKDINNWRAQWNVTAVPVSKRIVIDASHDGGVWWFPQSEQTGFNPDKYHQGKVFADLLRQKGFKVDELGSEVELKEEHFMGYFIVIRVNGFQTYTVNELDVYSKLVKRGMNLVFFTDHKKYDPKDELGDLLGLEFKGIAGGKVSKFTSHIITENLTSLNYIAGSVLINADLNPDIQILGWLGENDYADLNFNGIKDEGEPVAPPVMGILNYPKSKIFFIGDVNGLQIMPQPFIDNLIQWMVTDF